MQKFDTPAAISAVLAIPAGRVQVIAAERADTTVEVLPTDAAKGREVLSFFDWCYKNGDAAAGQLDYVALPAAVKDLIRKSWAKVLGPDGKPVYR